MKLKNIQTFLPFLAITLLVMISYWGLWKIFYQQDEWRSLGSLLVKSNLIEALRVVNLFQFIFAEGRLLSVVLSYFFIRELPLNTTPLAFYTLFFHVLNSILVFFLVKKVFQKDPIAYIASSFFAVSSVSVGAVYWLSTALGTLPAVTLIILSLYTFFEFIKNGSKKFFYISFLLIYISLFLKEIGLPLLVFYPIASLIFVRKGIEDLVKIYWLPVLLFGLIVVFRIYEMRHATTQVALFLSDTGNNYYLTILTRAFFYLLTSFSLIYVPVSYALNFSKFLTKTYYPFISADSFNLVSQTVTLDIVAIILSFSISLVFVFLLKRATKNEVQKILFFAGFALVSFLPYIVIAKSFSYLESRYYYLANVSAGVFLGWALVKFGELNKSIKSFLYVVFIAFIAMHLLATKQVIKEGISVSNERTAFIDQLEKKLSSLDKDKNIFYITGDMDYYIPNNKVPFQQGFGYTLMTLYYNTGKIPTELIDEAFLWDINSEGYREVDGKGFGYFWDKKKLDQAIKDYSLNRNDVYTYFYDSKTMTLK